MLQEIIEPAWLDAFEAVLGRCALKKGDTVAILAETQSRPVLPLLARLAAQRLGAQVFTLTLPSVVGRAGPPTRSTGASDAIQQIKPVIHALAASTLVVDCTVEGLMHAPELPAILKGGARVIYISNEHPEALVRLMPDDATEARVKDHIKRLRATKAMTVSSPAGTNLRISLEGAVAGGNWGFTTTLVLASGDVNLTFKRYVESAITLTIENDYVTAIEGAGLDAQLMRSYIEAWGDREAYAVSHVGYGLCDAARWDSMALYDKRDFNGTELRAFAGNFLYSTGANEVAGRYTLGHFDLPMRHCTVQLDGATVVDHGRVVD